MRCAGQITREEKSGVRQVRPVRSSPIVFFCSVIPNFLNFYDFCKIDSTILMTLLYSFGYSFLDDFEAIVDRHRKRGES